jgi:hypothetical protein
MSDRIRGDDDHGDDHWGHWGDDHGDDHWGHWGDDHGDD